MKEILINGEFKYKVLKNYNDALDMEMLNEKITDYFHNFDYIVGDWAYGKLRLKGFNKKSNKFYKNINSFEFVENYIREYCAYGCKHFILEKIEVEK